MTARVPRTAQSLADDFSTPPDRYRPTPLFWWSGDDVSLEKLEWQLDELARGGVGGTVVGYSHTPLAAVDAGRPTPMSPEWWELFRAFVEASGRRGMTVGFQEYVVINHLLLEAGTPEELPTAATLVEASHVVRGGHSLSVSADAPVLVAQAFRRTEAGLDLASRIDVAPRTDRRGVEWAAPEGDWLVSIVTTRPPELYNEPLAFDPLRPGAADHVIERFYGLFAEHLGDLLGSVFTVFFQDEFDLGITMPMWSDHVAREFEERKGYDLLPELAALWHDVGPRSATIRVDYSDVIVSLLEENYFKPIFEWHRAHGTTLAMDQLSRGDIAAGRKHYGDYSRTMRWFDAPGNDDPHLDDERNLFGFKVNSSIAHLYSRPTVWNEAFYGSGWGATPRSILAGLNEDFAYGATHVGLHGLYHNTRAGWWEWASPDFHFRQPYWAHSDALWPYLTRVSFLLSQGVHRSDVAVLDPVTDLEATLDSNPSAATAQTLVEGFVRAGCDADLVDFESLDRATTTDGILSVSGERYRVLVLPDCRVVRGSTLDVIDAFVAAGGIVVAFGRAPEGSETSGAPSREVAQRVAGFSAELALRGIPFVVERDVDKLVELVGTVITRDFQASDPGLVVTHRNVDGTQVYWVMNPRPEQLTTIARFRATGQATLWDPYDGSTSPLAALPDAVDGTTRIALQIPAGGATCVVFSSEELSGSGDGPLAVGRPATLVELSPTRWTSEVVPTLANEYGDFAFPAGPFGVRLATVEVEESTPRGRDWVTRPVGDGERLLVLGPISPDHDLATVEGELSRLTSVTAGDVQVVDGRDYRWRSYRFSEKTGRRDDPLLHDVVTGPHGLKGGVPDDFLDFGPASSTEGRVRVDPVGSSYFVWTTLAVESGDTERPGTRQRLVAGSRSAHSVWVDGEKLVEKPEMAAVFVPPWSLQDARITPSEATFESASTTRLLARFTQSDKQRIRAYLAVDPGVPAPGSPYLSWWSGDRRARSFDPAPAEPLGWAAVRMTTPPGVTAVTIVATAEARASDGALYALASERDGDSWIHVLRFTGDHPASDVVEILLEETPGRRGSATILDDIRFETGVGEIALGDWADQGLSEFSGIVRYSTTVTVDRLPAGPLALDLGEVATTARVRVNEVDAGIVLAPPFRVDVTGLFRAGFNTVVVEVANTLANFSSTLPSPYSEPAQCVSGLFGPVVLLTGEVASPPLR